eukprot:2367344-Amphidinium_carterae.2
MFQTRASEADAEAGDDMPTATAVIFMEWAYQSATPVCNRSKREFVSEYLPALCLCMQGMAGRYGSKESSMQQIGSAACFMCVGKNGHYTLAGHDDNEMLLSSKLTHLSWTREPHCLVSSQCALWQCIASHWPVITASRGFRSQVGAANRCQRVVPCTGT